MVVFFVGAALGIVLINITKVPSAIVLIVKSAFTGTAAVGGFGVEEQRRNGNSKRDCSFGFQQRSRTGFVYNGSYSQAHVEHPVRQGLSGMFEVFVDTMLVCTVMSLSIIVSGQWSSGLEGAALSVSAFDAVYGAIGAKLIAIAILLFGITTQTGWFMYYDVLLRHALSKNIALKNKILMFFRVIYPLLSLLTIFYTVHYGLPTGTVWLVTDFFSCCPDNA